MLQIKRVSKRFEAFEALASVDLAVDRGEIVGIVGTSGCGKSTLLRIVAGLETPNSGSVTLDGVAVTSPRPEVGLVFQEPRLMPWLSVRENVEFALGKRPRDQRRSLAEAALARVGLATFADALPQQLSGGMAQRVTLCRALITNPKLLLMDEPFSALDALTRDDMSLELLRVWERYRNTVMFVTHSIREAVFLSDRVIVLSPRPAVLVRDLAIDLPRPRELAMQETTEFNRYCAELRASLGR
ncbi:MAG TPA: ABC transporter ATP-binding protein [Stellaceae bacterium]|nr:ABC transporter ATP-binding protein [Stellaceae bacterium]